MNYLKEIFDIKYPIIQAGMVWCSGWKMATAVSKCGGLGVIGAGSMPPEVLEEHLLEMKNSGLVYAVNLPLFYSKIEEQIELLQKYKVPIVISSAGSPSKYIGRFKKFDAKVFHVVSSLKFALKAQEAGVDAIIAEGFEAGGHNGKEENTSWVLLELLRGKLSIPYFIAGGMFSGASLAAAQSFGASGIQVGTRFACSQESSAHKVYKQNAISATEGDTALTLKELMGVRLLKTPFYNEVKLAYEQGANQEALLKLLGKGRSKAGIFEGNLDKGEFEIGQIAAKVNKIESCKEIIDDIMTDYYQIKDKNDRF